MLGRRALARGLNQLAPPLRGGTCRSLATGVIPGLSRKLDDVVKLDLFAQAEPDRVLHLWAMHHSDKPDLVGAAAEPAEFERIVARGTESPSFVWPVKREGGHMLLYSQYSPADFMFAFTFLEDYRRSPGLAPPWMSVLLYGDLIPSKGLALLRAEADSDRLTKEETQGLLKLLRRVYGGDDYDKVWAFNHFQKRFDLDAYVKSV